RMTAVLPVKEFAEDQYVVMATREAVIKKCSLAEFDNPMARGIIAISLDEGDELIAVEQTDGHQFVFLGTHNGKAIRFLEEEVRLLRAEEGDKLASAGLIPHEEENGAGEPALPIQ